MEHRKLDAGADRVQRASFLVSAGRDRCSAECDSAVDGRHMADWPAESLSPAGEADQSGKGAETARRLAGGMVGLGKAKKR